jgi:oligopeptide/dipeptide ABC transporter ATP-binding protein
MYLGRIVEIGPANEIFQEPRHPYTQALLQAIPRPDPEASRVYEPIQGEAPSPLNPPPGCAFHPRCPFAQELCKKELPRLEPADAAANATFNHTVACLLKDEI